MLLRSRILFRLSWRPKVQSCLAHGASVNVFRNSRSENVPSQRIFPIQETVLTQIHHAVLLNDSYKGRVMDRSLKDQTSISSLPLRPTKQQLKALAQQELVDFIKVLAYSTFSQDELVDFSVQHIVEEECCCRAKNIDSADMLLIADAFFSMRYRCSDYFSFMFREFEHRWSSMQIQKEDVVQLAMCIIMARKFPILLVKNIENFLNSHTEEFTASELSVICSAFFMTNTSFGNVEVLEKLSTAALNGIGKSDLRLYQIGSILKALRHAHFAKPSFYNSLGDALSNWPALENEAELVDLSNIAFAYASVRTSHATLFARISSVAARLVRSQSYVRVKDVGRLVWSFALLQEPLDKQVKTSLLFLLQRDVYLMTKFSEAFIEALLGLAMMKTYHVDLLQKLFNAEFPKQKHVADFRLDMIDTAARLECADYASLHLKPDIRRVSDIYKLKIELCARQGLLSMITTLYQLLGDPAYVLCHHVFQFTKITDIELRVDSCGRLVKLNDNLSDVSLVHSMKTSPMSQSYTQNNSITNQILGHSTVASEDRVNGGLMHIMPEKTSTSSHRRVIVKLMGWNQYIVNKPMLTGFHQMELRLLRTLGYEVLVIPAGQSQQLDAMSPSERVDYVRDIIVNQLNINISD